MRTYKRADRVKQVIQQEISQILQFEMKDPRLSLLSVTNVELTADLREAKIFISSLDVNLDRKECLAGLKRANGFIRGLLGRRLTLKFIPTIQFYFDESLDHQQRILALIDEIHRHDNEGDGSY
ncbi:ribosome-binding factor A [Candidatus Moduliflexus flocculans]|uniref:Ribosome-binding factor A n=1 Tax=Candidatus Moduliflexus flocculans TaxID=1499966 RepID=A0A081BSH3_9BACT|nr:ribosome-binding factor A [Candidatus Moduliflexus flocculans]